MSHGKEINCLLCTLSENHFHLTKGQCIPVKHPGDVEGLVCSWCVQVLVSIPQENLRAAYELAMNKGMTNKAKAMQTFIDQDEEEFFYVRGEANKSHPDMDRTRAGRKARTACH